MTKNLTKRSNTGAAFDRLVQLFEYYSYFVFTVFLDKKTRETFLSEEEDAFKFREWTFLRDEMRRICQNESSSAKIGAAAPTSMVLLDDAKTSYGLSTRVAAADSLIFLVQVFRVRSVCGDRDFLLLYHLFVTSLNTRTQNTQTQTGTPRQDHRINAEKSRTSVHRFLSNTDTIRVRTQSVDHL